jgi:hypothetical protein
MRYARTPREAEVAALAILKALGCDDDHEDGGAATAADGAADPAPTSTAAPSSSTSLAVGFDIEWTATFKRGQPPGRVALVQICYETATGASAAASAEAAPASAPAAAASAPNSSNPPVQAAAPASAPPNSSTTNPTPSDHPPSGRGCCAVVLFHVAHCGVPPALERLLSDSRVLKVGLGCRTDAQKLAQDWPGADAWPLGDLGSEALRRGLFPNNGNGGGGNGGNGHNVWSLAGLVRELLPGGPRLPKPQALRTGRWDDAPLTAAQRQYASADAFASLAVWRALEKIAPLPTPSQEAMAALARLQERQQREEEEERALRGYRAVGRAAAEVAEAAAAGGDEQQQK